ncbi:(R)-specific enoyl-CoA hydratase [Oligella sp. MSHR50489EDL]|uniref:MaoC family dehydratase n=1 Tax=Oligella sp. MSHR50489EDL TaxID=3139409 RepID=UPI003D81A2B5
MLSIDKFTVGMTTQIERAFSAQDVELFAKLSGDCNPIHLDEAYAKTTAFGQRIVHGALASSIFSNIFGNILPGPGCIYLKSNLVFLKPIYLDAKIEYKVEITEIIKEKSRIILKTSAHADGKEFISGTAEIYIPKA